MQQVLKAAMERLLDYDDKVRSAAVALICEVAVQDLRVRPCWMSLLV